MSLMVHQLRWDVRAIWPAAAVMLALLLAKIWALTLADGVRQSEWLSMAQADTYAIAAAWLVISLWQPMRPFAGQEPDWRIRPLPRAKIALAKLLLLLAIIVLPVHVAELWLLHQQGFRVPLADWAYGMLGSLGLICGLSAAALLVRQPVDLIAALVTAGLLMVAETALASYLARLSEPMPPEIRGLRALTLVTTALVIGCGRLSNRSQTWLWVAMLTGLAVYVGLRLVPAATPSAKVAASVQAGTPVVQHLNIQLPLDFQFHQPGAYRVNTTGQPLRLNGAQAQPLGQRSETLGEVAALLLPEYRSIGPVREQLRLAFSVPPGELRSGPVTFQGTLQITPQSLSVAGRVPLEQGARLRGEDVQLQVQKIGLAHGVLELVVGIDSVHSSLQSPNSWRFALAHPVRREVWRGHSYIREWSSRLQLTRRHSRSTQVLRLERDQLPIAAERWLEGAELLLVAVRAQPSASVPVEVDAYLDAASTP
ncbi:MAG: hypothetical protein AAF358_24340 [Pseudomonadota bacterium]